jgi:hypothetical protein
VGLHFNGIAIAAAPLPPESEQTPEERAYVRALAAYRLTVRIPTKSPAYSDFNAPTIPISIRPPFRDIPAHFSGPC